MRLQQLATGPLWIMRTRIRVTHPVSPGEIPRKYCASKAVATQGGKKRAGITRTQVRIIPLPGGLGGLVLPAEKMPCSHSIALSPAEGNLVNQPRLLAGKAPPSRGSDPSNDPHVLSTPSLFCVGDALGVPCRCVLPRLLGVLPHGRRSCTRKRRMWVREWLFAYTGAASRRRQVAGIRSRV